MKIAGLRLTHESTEGSTLVAKARVPTNSKSRVESNQSMEYLRIRNFERFQHYTDRRPPWIKLYRDLWADHRFFSLSEDERYVYISLLIVASQNDNKILNNSKWLARECLTSIKLLERALKALSLGKEPFLEEWRSSEKATWNSRYVSKETRSRILARDKYCVQCGIDVDLEIDHVIPISHGGDGSDDNLQLLCRSCNRSKHNKTDARQMLDICSMDEPCSGVAETEVQKNRNTETETETETELEPPIVPLQGTTSFDEFWNLYPKKIGKGAALKAWKKLKGGAVLLEKINQAVLFQRNSAQWRKDNGQYIPNPATWLNQGRWDDEVKTTEKPGILRSIDQIFEDYQREKSNN